MLVSLGYGGLKIPTWQPQLWERWTMDLVTTDKHLEYKHCWRQLYLNSSSPNSLSRNSLTTCVQTRAIASHSFLSKDSLCLQILLLGFSLLLHFFSLSDCSCWASVLAQRSPATMLESAQHWMNFRLEGLYRTDINIKQQETERG